MNLYETQYIELDFERAGLFKAIRDQHRCKDVLYPGCLVHITPSLYFPHVVYVDKSEAAAQFFADEKRILDFVKRNKHYKQSAYIRFIHQDYSQPLPLREGSFDLLLALFAEGIAKSCAQYLRPGGLLLTNNHQGDAVDAVHDRKFRLTGIVRFQKGSYKISEALSDITIPTQRRNNNFLRQVNEAAQYVENEIYYLFERSPFRSATELP
jgi:SAM-dependent methyltransferase